MRRAFPLLAVLIVGCGHTPTTKTALAPKPAPPAPIDPWVLTNLDGANAEPAYLGNGLIGVRIGRNGGGLGPDGKPLGFFMIDEYDPSGEEKIRPMPHPLLVTWAVGNKLYKGEKDYDFVNSGGTPLDPRGGTGYRQALDMRTGVLTTEWSQAGVAVRCETAIHPSARVLGQRWTLKATKPTSFSVRSLDYGGPNDPQQSFGADDQSGVAVTVSPKRAVTVVWRMDKATAARSAGASVGGFRVQESSLGAGGTTTFERTLSFGPPSATPIKTTDDAAVQKATPKPYAYDEIAKAAAAAWKRRWTSDIEIDGPAEDQQAVRSFLFYLRASIAPGARRAIAPMALSSDIYGGHVFWDADIWTFPALMLTDPDLAREIPNYRLDRMSAAIKNADDWLRAGAPTGSGKAKPRRNVFGLAAKFPWESSVSGLETVPGPSRFEDHITGSVFWGLSQAARLGLADPGKIAERAVNAGASFYDLRSELDPSGDGLIELKGTMSPDENHIGDNDLYTNLLAMWLGNHRKWRPQTYKLPKDATSFLTYDDDPVRGYKQAAAVLACYPLQYPPAEAQTRTMLERFAPKTNANGPAMTDSIHGLLWARIGEPERGYDAWRKGWVDFTRHPLLTFSEKRNVARTYFATGAGGSLQTVLYGFAGLRLDYRKADGAFWSRPLADGAMLSVKPSLPKAWKRVRLKGLTLPDGRYTFDIRPGKVSAVKDRS